MEQVSERERRLRILESPEKLDAPFGWAEFIVLAVLGTLIPAVLVAVGWTAGA